MLRPLVFALSLLLMGAGLPPKVAPVAAPGEITFTADGKMNYPANYREWVYLTSGLGMSYSAVASDHPMFDNVFVNPTAYKAFLATGTWPDKTALVLEVRDSETKASIDQHGHSQSGLMGVEVHVRDEKLPGKWGFFEFDPDKPGPAPIVAHPASCYTCHEAHAAVDTTFVQFYPTLIGVAKEKKTLSANFLKEMPGAGLLLLW